MCHVDVLKVVYFAHIQSRLSYGAVLWGSKAYSSKQFRIQRKAIRLTCDLPERNQCKESFEELEILTLPSNFVLQCLTYVEENLNNFVEQGISHGHQSRGRNNSITNRYEYASTQQTFLFIGVKLFNSLSEQFRGLQNLVFKRRLKILLISNPIYTFQEFYELARTL